MSSWRKRCPKGHTALKKRQTRPVYYCESCDVYYPGQPFEAGEHEFPVEGAAEGAPSKSALSILSEIVDICSRELRSGCKARELHDGGGAKVSVHLKQLHERGLIQAANPETGRSNRWRPTDAGRRLGGANQPTGVGDPVMNDD